MTTRHVQYQRSLLFFFVVVISAVIALKVFAAAQDVLTYHGDNYRTGWFSSETQLTTSNVNANSFGLLKAVTLDGRVDAEPLYVTQQSITNKGTRNVVYVATENNSIYAIDAGTGAILWHRKFGAPVPDSYKSGDDNVFPVMGILSTPVIDRGRGNLYFVSDSYNGKTDNFYLHAISLTNGLATIPAVQIKTTALLADGTTWKFNPQFQLQRPGLLEANGSIYVAFGSNGDINPDKSRGVILRYDANTLLRQGGDVTDTLSPNTNTYYLSSIWQSGYGLAADDNGDVYFGTGNSDPGTPSYSAAFNRPDSIVHLSADLNSLVDSFTPSNYFPLDQSDLDLGSAGTMIIPPQPGNVPHMVIGGAKDGRAFLLNRDSLGGYTPGGPDHVLQTLNQGNCWCGPAYFVGSNGNSYVLTGGQNGITSYQMLTNPAPSLVQASTTGYGPNDGLPDYGGAVPVVSSNGTAAGTAIVWFTQKPQSSSDSDPGTPIALMAYDASNLQKQLFSASAGTWTHAVNSNANIVPTVANGKVYVASNKQLQIFGLLGKNAKAAKAPAPSQPDVVACGPSESALAATGNVGTHEYYGTVCRATANELQLSLRNGRSVTMDISKTFLHNQPIVLAPGRPVHVHVEIAANGTARAVSINRGHMLSALTPADR
jgi:hypothetical protein